MKNKVIITGITVLFLLVVILGFSGRTSARDRRNELESRIQERSIEWQAEADEAERGRIAQERMKALNRQNNIDRLELQNLE